MLSRVLRTIRDHELLGAGDRVLCAVSGGPDSMALMHVLWELRERSPGRDARGRHRRSRPATRGAARGGAGRGAGARPGAALAPAGGRRARGARRRPARGRFGVLTASTSWQDVARRLRLAALADLAGGLGADKIALGHQADDQAETVLFRILRGTGVRGLAGIPYRRDRLVRPLLDVERAQILTYLRRRSIPFAEDPSNGDARFSRARLRHQVLPALRAENPRLDEALRALAADAARLELPLPDAGGAGPEPAGGHGGRAPATRAGRHPSGRRGRRAGRDLLRAGDLVVAVAPRLGGRAARRCPGGADDHRAPATTDGRTRSASPSVRGSRSPARPASTPSCCRGRCDCAPRARAIACGRAAGVAAASCPTC